MNSNLSFTNLVVFIVLTIAAGLIFIISKKSIDSLETEILTSFPFRLRFADANEWGIVYFVITLLALSLLFFFLIQGNFNINSGA